MPIACGVVGDVQRWKKLVTRTVYSGGPGGSVHLAVDDAVRPDGRTVEYPHVVTPDAVRILAVHRGQVPQVRQHIYLHDVELTDLPGGMIDAHEAPEDAARRELAEETGLQATWLHPLGAVATARSVTAMRVHLYLAHGCVVGAAAPDPGESIQQLWRSWSELVDGRETGSAMPSRELEDAASLAVIHRVQSLLRKVGGPLPTAGLDVTSAAWHAHSVAALRDPLLDERLSLIWLDLAVSGYAELAPIVAELEAAFDGPSAPASAWAQAAKRFAALTD